MSLQINSNPQPNAWFNAGDTSATGATGFQFSPELLTFLNSLGQNQDTDANSLFDVDSNALTSSAVDDANLRLTSLQGSVADIFTIMALMVQMAKEQREGARQVRDAERMSQQAELQNAADKMREAADMALAAGIVSGVFKIGTGAVSIGGGVFGMKQIGNASKTEGGPSMADLDMIRNQGRIFDGSGQMVGGLGDVVAAVLQHESADKTAEQKEAEAAAQQHETSALREGDFMSSLQELIREISSLMQEIQQTNNESQRRAASV
jgi:hypothetical protein